MPERETVGRSGQSSTLDILAKLELRRAAIMQSVAGIDEPNTAIRCDALRGMFDELYISIRGNIAPLEQDKGIARGLELAATVLLTHCDLWKAELPEIEQNDQLELALKAVNRGTQSILDAARKQRRDLERKAGKFDGAVNSAMSALGQVEKYAEHFERSKAKQAEIEQGGNGVGHVGDEVDQALEAQAAKRATQIEGATVTSITKKTTTKKKGPQRKKRPKK
jgi:hypothetical protein